MAKSKTKQAQEEAERPAKHPRVPSFPASAEATAQKLREIIDANDERRSLAYAALSRLCVLWTSDALHVGALAGGQFGVVVNDLVGIMSILFPDGEGL